MLNRNFTSASKLAPFALLFVFGLSEPAAAGAQAATDEVDLSPEAVAASAEIGQSGVGPLTLDEELARQLEDAKTRSRRARIGLYAGTGAFVLGIVLTAVWVGKNCSSDGGAYTCNDDAQPGLSGTGGFFIGSGAITMITSGIMLGVRNKKIRGI
ncbi:MAG: hypothetical protein JRF42_03925, partial [Deltaproteobacteria bacterium]|nr:hypothetical protein [Deltaproteobacteria bacterium]